MAAGGLDFGSFIEKIEQLCACLTCEKLSYPDPCYQCRNGHIICGKCLEILKSNEGTAPDCPTCHISYDLALSKCIFITKVVSGLPKDCERCGIECTYETIKQHLEKECKVKRTPSESFGDDDDDDDDDDDEDTTSDEEEEGHQQLKMIKMG